jgi:hypothetical protein
MSLSKVVARTHTDAMEQLQEGYVSAVAATAGATAQRVTRDMHKWDLELVRQPDVALEETAVRVQMKSTTGVHPRPGDTHFGFRFESRTDFESLAMRRKLQKRILVVMLIHKDQHRWTYAHQRAMLVRHCCYWLNLEGLTAPVKPVRPVVAVPLANVFDATALTAILNRIEAGGVP